MRSSWAFEAWLGRLCEHRSLCFTAIALAVAVELLPTWDLTPDAVCYLSIARSIATGHGLRNLGYTHIAYPPGYPLLLSCAFRFASPLLIVRVIHWLLAMAVVLGLAQWARGHCPESAALLMIGLVMANATSMTYSRRALSDFAFMATAIWAVVPLNTAIITKTPQRYGQIVIGATLVLIATMIREAGLLFATAFVVAVWIAVWQASLRVREGLAMTLMAGAPAMAALLAFLLYDESTFRSVPVFGTHLSGFLDSRVSFGSRVIEGLRLQIFAIGRVVVPGMFKAYGGGWAGLDSAIYLAVCGLVAIGWWRGLKRSHDIYFITLPLYLVLYVIWGFDAGTRYMLPMLPVLCFAIWYLVEPYEQFRYSVLTALIVAHLGVAVGYWAMVEIPAARECNREWAPMARIASLAESAEGPIETTGGTPECARLILSYLVDRPVLDPKEKNLGVEPLWIVAPVANPAPAGFTTELICDRYRLFRRVAAVPIVAR